MQAQLKQKWDPWVMKCEGSGAVTLGDDGVGAGYICRILSQYTPNPTDVYPGIVLAVQSTKGGIGPITNTDTRYMFAIDALGINPSTVVVAGFRSAVYSHVEIDNLRCYHLGNCWRLDGGQIRWYIEGVLHDHYEDGGWTLFSAANMRTRAAIPLIGIDPQKNPAALDGVAPPL